MGAVRCSFCGRSRPERFPRVSGPMGVSICAECVADLMPHASAGEMTSPVPVIDWTREALQGFGAPHEGGGRPPAAAPSGCSFCGSSKDDLKQLFGTHHGPSRICDSCVRMAQEMLQGETRASET
jgi:hypothetical protein